MRPKVVQFTVEAGGDAMSAMTSALIAELLEPSGLTLEAISPPATVKQTDAPGAAPLREGTEESVWVAVEEDEVPDRALSLFRACERCVAGVEPLSPERAARRETTVWLRGVPLFRWHTWRMVYDVRGRALLVDVPDPEGGSAATCWLVLAEAADSISPALAEGYDEDSQIPDEDRSWDQPIWFDWVAPTGEDDPPWPVDEAAARVLQEDESGAPDLDPMFQGIADFERRRRRLSNEAASFQVEGSWLHREVEQLGDLQAALADLPPGLQVLVSGDGKRFTEGSRLAVFVPPRTRKHEMPTVFIVPKATAEDWCDFAERQRDDPKAVPIEVMPSNGMDYLNEHAVRAAWHRGERFDVVELFHPLLGQSLRRTDFAEREITYLVSRYDRGSRLCPLHTDDAG